LARVVRKVEAAAGGTLAGVPVAVWGLTFKANTDDRRDSPSVEVTRRLVDLGARVQAFDPTVRPEEDAPDDLRGLELTADPYDAATGAQVLVVLTEWDAFRWLDYDRVRSVMAVPAVVDARNLLDPAALRRMGFTYTGIGRR
jgi:UDPglucose 6-dehydrogenase